MGKKLDKLCDHMRELHKMYNSQKAKNDNDIDTIISLRSRVCLLESLLQEAAFIKKEKNELHKNYDEEDVGC